MKRFSCLPLLCALVAGCSAPATQNSNAAPNDAAPVAANTAPDATPATAPDAPPAASAAKTYRVSGTEGVPPEAQAAQAKVTLPPPPLNTKIPDHPRILMVTSRGPITLELDAKAAPLHVRSVLYLASKGFYNGIKFHRYADLTGDGKGFIIQGGDPFTKSADTEQFAGTGGPGYEIPREYNDLKHQKLVIAAARTQDPDSAGSQFYITQGAVPFLDEAPGYTVFGRVIKGQTAALALREGDTIKSVTLQK